MKKISVFAVFFIYCSFLSYISIAQEDGQKKLSFKDVVQPGMFYAKGVYGLKSMKDGNNYCVIEHDSLNAYSYKSGKLARTILTTKELIPEGDTVPLKISGYTFSHDESKILIPAETESIYRHSSKSNYYIYDISAKELSLLSSNGKQRLADFSPDGQKVAFIRENNIFIKDLNSGEEKQLTTDGEDRKIINGSTDWVYEEEFGFSKAFFWSPDGNKIAFYRFDESDVVEYNMQMWGELYPEDYRYKYPKAGEDNSLLTIHVYDLGSGQVENLDIGSETDQYIPRIKWTQDASLLSILRMNRLQNKLEILILDTNTGSSRVIYTETNKYFIEITDDLNFLDDKKHFIITSEQDGYNHIYLYTMEGKLVRQLTRGDWVVKSMIGYDAKRKLVYFTATKSSPLNRDLFTVDLSGKIKKLSEKEGNNSPKFSANYDYYINNFSSVSTPAYITVNNHKGKVVRVLEENEKLLETTREYGFSRVEFFNFTTDDNVKLYGWKILPHDFDPAKKYPVLMYVYGGPGSQTVVNRWSSNIWYQYLAQEGFMIVSVDNRGTGSRGEEFKKMTYQELGKYETIDQIAAARYLTTFDYVDSGRLAIWGWSYGGYMSSLCITKGAEYFDVAIAVAPVTNWRYYDNIYTERYMRTPQENPDGYDDNSPINHVDKLEGKYLIIHGSGDDNVHVQNTIDMVSALVEANKQFDMQLYPNKNHGIYGGNTRYHLYKKMTDFLMENLKDE